MTNLPLIYASAHIEAKMSEPFIVEASDSGNKAQLNIVGYIHEWSKASSRDLEAKVNDLIAKGYQDAHIYINSKGGSTLEAAEIFNTLRKFKGKLIATGGAIVASAAGYIATRCDEFHVAPNTQFMYHRPKATLSGNYDEIIAQNEMVKNTEADYIEKYAAKSNLTKAQIVKNWSKGDVWLMGKQIVSDGFADMMIKDEAKITAADAIMIEACGAPVNPKINFKNQKSNKVEKIQLIASLGLEPTATDAEIQAAITKNATDAKAFADLIAKNANDAIEKKKKDVSDFLNAAVASKKITADQVPNYTAMAEGNFDAVKATVDALPVVSKPSPEAAAASAGVDADRKDWTFAKYQEEDPEAFTALMESDPVAAEELVEKHYKTK